MPAVAWVGDHLVANFVITVPADVLTFNDARPSVATKLRTNLYIHIYILPFSLRYSSESKIFYINRMASSKSGRRYLTKYRPSKMLIDFKTGLFSSSDGYQVIGDSCVNDDHLYGSGLLVLSRHYSICLVCIWVWYPSIGAYIVRAYSSPLGNRKHFDPDFGRCNVLQSALNKYWTN